MCIIYCIIYYIHIFCRPFCWSMLIQGKLIMISEVLVCHMTMVWSHLQSGMAPFMNTHSGSCVTPRSSVLMGATVIHSEAGRKGPGWLWDWGQQVVNEKSMVLWHLNLSPNFITGIRCQEKSVLWRWLVGPYWLSWPMCVVSWWRE